MFAALLKYPQHFNVKSLKSLIIHTIVAILLCVLYTEIMTEQSNGKDSYIGNAFYMVGFVAIYSTSLAATVTISHLKLKGSLSVNLTGAVASYGVTLYLCDQYLREWYRA